MPVVATVVATLGAAWLARDRPVADAYESVRAHRKFADVLSQQVRTQNVRVVQVAPPDGTGTDGTGTDAAGTGGAGSDCAAEAGETVTGDRPPA
jgi:hypothetical protein